MIIDDKYLHLSSCSVTIYAYLEDVGMSTPSFTSIQVNMFVPSLVSGERH